MISKAAGTELFHLAGDRREMETVWKFLSSGAIRVAIIEDSELPEIQTLVLRYRVRPVDFADATLVSLARGEQATTAFTVDHVTTYRIEGR